jgi:benzoyl-CoA-dihydrodiol lyase
MKSCCSTTDAHWLSREILLYWKRVLKRVDLTSRSMVALVEHGSCFAGFLAEILFACDRSYMMEDEFEGDNRPGRHDHAVGGNFGPLPMANDLTRLETRFSANRPRSSGAGACRRGAGGRGRRANWAW